MDPRQIQSEVAERNRAKMARQNARLRAGLTLTNANGDIDPTSLGYKEAMDTLTFIRKRVVEQRYYEVPFADFLPVVVGEGAFSQAILTNLSISASGDFEDGNINQGAGNDRISSVQAGVTPITVKIVNWAKALGYSIFEIQQALASLNWDYIVALETARKKNWDLGLQEIAFLGSKSDTGVLGMYTQSDVNIDTSTIPTPISDMTTTQFAAFVAALMTAYNANANSTVLPNMFTIPQSDWLGLATPVSKDFPFNSKLEYLKKAFAEVVPGGVTLNFAAYGDASHNTSRGVNKQRYILSRYDVDTWRMDVPVNYTSTAVNTANNFQFQNVAYGQYSGARAYRPLEILYLDIA